ncbi:lysR substrate binding domain-containing protein [Ditylenchus destructor]|nr:lysR substrate binding domain-containing protein [Ditylenchus destructor]
MDALRELVATDAPPTPGLGVPQTIGDVVLLDALKHLRTEYPDLRAQVATGWGSQLVGKIERGELDAAAALFPAGKIFPDNIVGESIGKMELVVVCAKAQLPKKPCKLADVKPERLDSPIRMAAVSAGGCSGPCPIRAGIAGELETFGTELQLGLVAEGLGLGLVPRPLLERSVHREQLAVMPLKDFKPVMDLWLIYPHFLGNLQGPVDAFATSPRFPTFPTLYAQRVTAEEWEVRVKLAAAYRLAALYKWTDHIYTHFSARVPGPDAHFLINAFGLLFDEINASNLVKVDLDGTIVDDPTGLGINYAGYVIHSAIHGARHDLQACCTPTPATVLRCRRKKTACCRFPSIPLVFSGRVAYHGYEGIALDLDERERLVADLGDKSVMILRNHGNWSGPAISDRSPGSGECGVDLPAVDVVEKVEQQAKANASGEGPGVARHWNALIRQLERSDTDYKN